MSLSYDDSAEFSFWSIDISIRWNDGLGRWFPLPYPKHLAALHNRQRFGGIIGP